MCFGGGGQTTYAPTPTQEEVNARTGNPYAPELTPAQRQLPDETRLTRIDENAKGDVLGKTSVAGQ